MELKFVYTLFVLFLPAQGGDELHRVNDYASKTTCLESAKRIQEVLNNQYKGSDVRGQTFCIQRAKYKIRPPRPYMNGGTPGA